MKVMKNHLNSMLKRLKLLGSCLLLQVSLEGSFEKFLFGFCAADSFNFWENLLIFQFRQKFKVLRGDCRFSMPPNVSDLRIWPHFDLRLLNRLGIFFLFGSSIFKSIIVIKILHTDHIQHWKVHERYNPSRIKQLDFGLQKWSTTEMK